MTETAPESNTNPRLLPIPTLSVLAFVAVSLHFVINQVVLVLLEESVLVEHHVWIRALSLILRNAAVLSCIIAMVHAWLQLVSNESPLTAVSKTLLVAVGFAFLPLVASILVAPRHWIRMQHVFSVIAVGSVLATLVLLIGLRRGQRWLTLGMLLTLLAVICGGSERLVEYAQRLMAFSYPRAITRYAGFVGECAFLLAPLCIALSTLRSWQRTPAKRFGTNFLLRNVATGACVFGTFSLLKNHANLALLALSLEAFYPKWTEVYTFSLPVVVGILLLGMLRAQTSAKTLVMGASLCVMAGYGAADATNISVLVLGATLLMWGSLLNKRQTERTTTL